MGAPNLSSLFAIGMHALNTVVDRATGTITATGGNVFNNTSDSSSIEWWQHVGFRSRPPKPTKNQAAASMFVIRRGANDACIATRDVRGQALSASLDFGETCIYGPGADGNAQGRTTYKGDGFVITETRTGNTSGGQTISWVAGPTGITGTAPWGTFSITSSGVVVTGITAIGGAPQPLAIGPKTFAALTAIETFIAAVGTAAGNPTYAAFATATVTAATAATTSLTPILPLLQTTTTTAT